MSCCAPSIPRARNGDELLKRVREFKDMNFAMKLKEGFNYEFDSESGRWKEKFDIKHTSNLEELNVVVNNLKETLNKKHLEIKILEKRYLARMAKLLLMAQTHCEIKDNILDIFEEGIGVKLDALKAYTGVMRPYPHPRSEEAIEGLAAYRGVQAGCNYAEAFESVFFRT